MCKIKLKKALIIMIVSLLSYFWSQAGCAVYSNDDKKPLLEDTNYTGDYSYGYSMFFISTV